MMAVEYDGLIPNGENVFFFIKANIGTHLLNLLRNRAILPLRFSTRLAALSSKPNSFSAFWTRYRLSSESGSFFAISGEILVLTINRYSSILPHLDSTCLYSLTS